MPADPAAAVAEGDDDEDRPKLERQKLREEIRARRLKNDLAEQRLIDRAEAELVLAELCLRIKARLEALPDEVEMLFPAELRGAIKRDLQDKLWLLMKELATWSL